MVITDNISKLNTKTGGGPKTKAGSRFKEKVIKDLKRNRYLYLMALPMIIFYIIFSYVPMGGAIIAFKDYTPSKGIFGSHWVGFKHFQTFFSSYYFWRILRNTILINIYSLIFGFPAPIILALLLNAIKNKIYKNAIQTISYLPHFVSLVVICGIITDFTSADGIINTLFPGLTKQGGSLLQYPEFFRTIYISSDIWQTIGWGSIIYLASLVGIDPQLYEASTLDGAGKWKQLWNVTIPGIMPTIVIMFILRVGSMMNLGFEKIILLYNPTTYETADVISSFVYRKGILEFGWSFSSAVGLFNSLINFALLLGANWMSRKLNDTSLW